MTLADLIFVSFSNKVVALHRDTGETLWHWKAPHGTGYAAILLDGDRLIVSVMGYTYCLDPATGAQMWENTLPGLGTGIASLASVNGSSNPLRAAAEDAEQRKHATQSSS